MALKLFPPPADSGLMEKRQAKRIMAFMPEEEPVFVRLDGAQYSARLINISSGGALILVRDCDLESNPGDVCQLFFAGEDRMFRVEGEVLRKSGHYAAFRFLDLSPAIVDEIAAKIARMESLALLLTPTLQMNPLRAH